MASRQVSALLTRKNGLTSCIANAVNYSTASERTRMVDKNMHFDPSSTAQKAKEATAYAREQFTGEIKHRTPDHSPSIIRPKPGEVEHDSKGAVTSGIEMQHQEKKTEEEYWEHMKAERHTNAPVTKNESTYHKE